MLSYLGTVSGRDEEKIANANLNIEFQHNTPYFREAKVYFKIIILIVSADTEIHIYLCLEHAPHAVWLYVFVMYICRNYHFSGSILFFYLFFPNMC